jgi:hypothetical protein
MTRWNRIKNNYFKVLPFVYAPAVCYFKVLPFVYVPTVCFFITTGINNELEKRHNKIPYNTSHLNLFFIVLGYSTLGIVTAITYPVSFPLIGIYIFSKRAIQVSKNEI